VVALGITTDGVKIPLGLWEGSTENATVATALLSDLVRARSRCRAGWLCVLDGAKALRKALRDVFGVHTPMKRCVMHYTDARVMPTRLKRRCSERGSGEIRSA
jgi:putative transposase